MLVFIKNNKVMVKKQLIRLINEEISKYSFPNIDEQDDFTEAANSKEFQTQLIHDLATNISSSKFSNWNVVEEHNSINDMDLDEDGVNFKYDIEVDYRFNGNKIGLVIFVKGDNVPYSTTGERKPATYTNPTENPEINDIAMDYVDIDFFIKGGESIEMPWLLNNTKLKEKVIKNILSGKI